MEAGAFQFMPAMLPAIHRTLFQDLDPAVYRPGEFKTEALCKREPILNGDSVVYGDPQFVQAFLDYAFEQEAKFAYGPTFNDEQMENLADFVSRIWQAHPFCEGNTRTMAVFTVLYLRHLGFDADNAPFEKHARYFRDALVRANYRNARAGVMPDAVYLLRFFENMLTGGKNDLRSSDLVVGVLFDDPSLIRNV